jgi:hypothetical protein
MSGDEASFVFMIRPHGKAGSSKLVPRDLLVSLFSVLLRPFSSSFLFVARRIKTSNYFILL